MQDRSGLLIVSAPGIDESVRCGIWDSSLSICEWRVPKNKSNMNCTVD